MKKKLADRVQNISLSGIRVVSEKVRLLEEKGEKIFRFDMGRPDFDTPGYIKEAAKKAIQEGFVYYTPSNGIKELREAIAQKLYKDNNMEVDPDTELIVTVGTQQAAFISILGIINPGDEVLVPDPMYVYYTDWPELAGGKTVSIRTSQENNFKFSAEDIERRISPKTKMILINTPNNPTGVVLDKQTLEIIARVAKKRDLLVLSDECYEKMVYDGVKHYSIASFPGMRKRTITTNSFSKIYSMTGWRLGYVVADKEIIAGLLKVHQHTILCPCSFVQKGGLAALTVPSSAPENMVKEFERRRKLVLQYLNQMEGISYVQPQGAFYVFPSIKEFGMSSQQICDYLLEEAKVAVVPGSCFGSCGEGYVRMTYSTSYEDLQQGLESMEKALKRLKT